jgi:hypothetical protein
VRVRSAAGAVETEVLASDAVMRGVVCLPHGYGTRSTACACRTRARSPARATTT